MALRVLTIIYVTASCLLNWYVPENQQTAQFQFREQDAG